MAKDFIISEILTAFDTTGLTGVFQVVNAGGFYGSPFKLRIVNASDVDVHISYDEVNSNDIILADSDLILDFQSNSQTPNHRCLFRKGTTVSVAGAGAGTGLIYVTGYYQDR